MGLLDPTVEGKAQRMRLDHILDKTPASLGEVGCSAPAQEEGQGEGQEEGQQADGSALVSVQNPDA